MEAGRPIVIVDDDGLMLQISELCYKNTGLKNELVTFPSGEVVLAYLNSTKHDENKKPGLILLDINMPGLNGFEVLKQIRSDPEFSESPKIIMLSVSNSPADYSLAFELGANAYIVKAGNLAGFQRVFDNLHSYFNSAVG